MGIFQWKKIIPFFKLILMLFNNYLNNNILLYFLINNLSLLYFILSS